MIRTFWAALLALVYLLGLFGLAYAVDRGREAGRSRIDRPWVYSLSLAVYCTSWTFYGSVGRAAHMGLGFLPIYLGPTLVFLLGPTVLRRLISFCRAEGVTSVPDLLESLYGKGKSLGALATTVLVAGVTPYIALQLKAVGTTFDLISGHDPSAGGVLGDAAFWAALGLALFAILFGARTLDPSERHEGMVAAVAFESAVKLLVFLAIGAYITWGVGGGLLEIFRRAAADPDQARLFVLGPDSGTTLVEWSTLGILSTAAVLLLPRQFHMLVIENVREEHLLPATWTFPAYLLLINLLVLPVALTGLQTGATGSPDFYLLSIPLSRGRVDLAILAYLGGFSAATSMVVVSSVALATMILHHPGLSLIGDVSTYLRSGAGLDLSRALLHTKRLVIFAVILLGYCFKRWIGDSHTLVNIGLLSFSAVTQFAPAVFLGLYWRGGRRAGALTGLTLGFAVWAYTLLLPSFAESGWVSTEILFRGPWGIAFLRPRSLFGLEGLDPWTHALLWSAVFNLGGYLLVSLCARERPSPARVATSAWVDREELEDLLTRFVGAEKAHEVLGRFPERASPQVLLEAAERCLASALGTPSARVITQGFLAWPRDQAVEILDVFGGVSRSLAESRENLERRIRELSVLLEGARTLTRSLDTDTVLREILDLVRREFGFEYLAVRLLEPDGTLRIRSHLGLDQEYVEQSAREPSEDTYSGTCFLEGHTVVVEDTRRVEKPTLFHLLAEKVPVTALIQAPMIHEGRSIGVLAAYGTRGPMHFTDEFVDLFAALANQLALAVVNAQLYSEIQAYSLAMEEKVRERTAELEEANARLREVDRLKTEFLSTVSHELRTPLTSIRSFTEILLRYGVMETDKREEFLSIIHGEAERLARMINELLDLSKIEAGRLEFEVRPLNLAETLSSALDATRPLFANKGIDVHHRVESGLPPVLADRDRLLQVLSNLLSNAAKFSPDSGIVLIEARRRGAFALVSVSDQGPGIPGHRLGEVFERYTQVRDPQKAHPLGTGLGLSIARDIVRRMGGKIWVESEPGQGTKFSFTLPLN